ncbi:hypothetical protein IEQ11_16000 [Lysobacter capsici]|uniref:YiiX/YebB-like N1pC/P60 family cysteine hydrolase n=1 Tax=Lysobacter capsici TaxID=435897 RepID=UPI0017808CD7|nr:YiiX/YebB-like N1pC/P60 family cysteine hydrolase [Lysobacter capsici]UOF13247.1 hypothetical protein IEQ11_16000 [Lysobacter capsici]
MIWALIDFCGYRRRAGRFSDDYRKSDMGAAFHGEISESLLKVLRPGDVLLVQTLDSPISWLIMYLTNSEISHVAMYVGSSEIVHATDAGVLVEPIESLFGSSSRVLVGQWEMSEAERLNVVKRCRKMVGIPYGWRVVFVKGLRIATARDHSYFRWKFAIDICITLLLLDVIPTLLLSAPFFSWAIPAYATLILLNLVASRFKPLKFSESTAKPCDALTMIKRSGGRLLFDGFRIKQQYEANKASPE